MELIFALLLFVWLLSRVKIRVRYQPRDDEAPPSLIAANENRPRSRVDVQS